MSHSISPPSSSARRAQCSQSATWELQFPGDPDDEDAREGEAAHWVVQQRLTGQPPINEGDLAPNGVRVTGEMLDGADMMFDDVTAAMRPNGLTPTDVTVEQMLPIPRVHPLQFGTPDAYWLSGTLPGRPRLLLGWDYKFGHGPVEVYENMQLVEYTAGICEGVDDNDPGVIVVWTIVQPRAYRRGGPISRWRTTLRDMRALINVAANSFAEAIGPQPKTRVGPECRYCKARHACPTLQAASFAAMDEAKRTTPLVMDAAGAGLELRMIREAIKRLQARETGVEGHIESLIRQGQNVPGWTLAPAGAREHWTIPDEAVIQAFRMCGADVAKPPQAITPAQARQRKLDATMIAQLSARPKGALRLEPVDASLVGKVFFK